MSSMTRREALEANGGDGTLLDWTARFGTEEACVIPSTYFSPSAQTNRRRSRQRAFTVFG